MIQQAKIVRPVLIYALASLIAVLGASADEIVKTLDRKFPIGWCPFESRGSAGSALVFTAVGSAARITFEIENGRGACADTLAPCSADVDCPGSTCLRYCHPDSTGTPCTSDAECPGSICGYWNHLQLDDVAVVPKTVFDANVPGPSFGYESCYTNQVPPGQTSGGEPNAPAYDHDLGDPEEYLNLFDTAGSLAGWTGQVAFDGTISAPRHPQDSGNLDETGGALSIGRLSDGSGPASASFTVAGLTPGVQYVVFGWWSTALADSMTMTINTTACADVDGDGYVVCDGMCSPDPDQTCGDCDDGDALVHPGIADATCDGIDDDCDGSVDGGFPGGCACQETAPGLVSWWPGDGDASDVRGANDGTLQDGAGYGVGLVGQAFLFAGGDDHVLVPHDSSLDPATGSFTLAAWIKTSASGATQVVLSKYECGGFCPAGIATPLYELFVSNAGFPALDLRDSDGLSIQEVAGPTPVNDGVWHHLAARRDVAAGVMDVYVDGSLVASAPLASYADGNIGDSDGEPDPLLIGSVYAAGTTIPSGGFAGEIDEAMYFDRALRPAEIRAMFESGSAALCRCADADLDGYGADGGVSCGAGPAQDCDDALATVHPNAADATCDGIDEDCDGQVDEEFAAGCACAEPGSGLIGWWPADGNAADVRGGHDGVLQNGAAYASGEAGQAFDLDGIDDYVGNIGATSTYAFIQNTGVFTIAAWILLDDSFAFAQQAISANTGTTTEKGHFFLWENSAGQHRLRFAAMQGVNGVPAIDSVGPVIVFTGWHHFAVVGDGTHVTFYIDGQGALGTGAFVATSTGNSTRLLNLGRCPASVPECQLAGRIDDVQIYDRALTATEIQAIHQSGATGMCQCTDLDGDGFGEGTLSCPRGIQADCNDAEPLDWGVAGPADHLLLDDPFDTLLFWDDASAILGPGATYEVERGPILAAPVSSGPEICFASGLSVPQTTDSSIPPPGSGYWYLVYSKNSCGGGAPMCP